MKNERKKQRYVYFSLYVQEESNQLKIRWNII